MMAKSLEEKCCTTMMRLSVLSKVGALAGILDSAEALSAVARLSIPELADWCIVDVVEDGAVRRMEVAHRDPARAALAGALRAFPLDHAARRRLPAARALRAGRPLLLPDYRDAMLREETDGEYLALALQLDVRSVMVIPVTLSPARAITMTFITTAESGRRYGPEDLAVAEDLVRRAAQIVETARVHEQLRQTEARFRVALEHSNVTVFEQDTELRYRWIYNPPLGYSAEDVLGHLNAELLSSEDTARLESMDREVLRSGDRVQREVRISAPGGEPHHLLVTEEPLFDASGEIVGLTGAATDITDQKRAQEELARALVFREQMMAILGHDLRNPLGAVRALSTLLLRRDGLPEDVRDGLAEIGRAGQRMLELIGTLLDFTDGRFKGALPVAPVEADLHDVCRRVVGELEAAEPGRRIALELAGDGRGTFDPGRLAQVVSNLAGNALKHGARDGDVRVSVRGDDDDVVLEVTNEGPAIPPALMAVLFEPFCGGSTLRDASPARGLGLGLYIVRQIVTAHGGEVTVDSCDAATTFTVSLPRDSAAGPRRGRIAARPGAPAGFSGRV
jgi:PAS domain S-box-containing protein